jgi:hypothetical protein
MAKGETRSVPAIRHLSRATQFPIPVSKTLYDGPGLDRSRR